MGRLNVARRSVTGAAALALCAVCILSGGTASWGDEAAKAAPPGATTAPPVTTPDAAAEQATLERYTKHATLGETYYREGKWAEAVTELAAATATYRDPLLLLLLGSSYSHMNNWDQAASAYQAVLSAEPTVAFVGPARRGLGMAYLRQGKTTEGIEQLEKAVAVAPNDADTRTDLGKGYMVANRVTDAKKAFTEAIQLDPNQPGAHAGLGACAQMVGDSETAAREYLRALADKQAPAPVYEPLLQSLTRYARTGDAAPLAREALQYYPDDKALKALAEPKR